MISAAIHIVAERGLDSLTLAECGERAGYSRGLAAHYFQSKDGLTGAIASRIVTSYGVQLGATRRRRGIGELVNSVSFYIDTGRKNVTTLRAFHAVLGAAFIRSPLSVEIATLNRNTVDSFATTIRQGMAHGEIRKDVDATAQAALIVASLRGVMTQWLIDPARVDLDAIKRELVRDLKRRFTA